MNLQNRNRVTGIENKHGSQGVHGGGINWEMGTDKHTHTYEKQVTNDNLV